MWKDLVGTTFDLFNWGTPLDGNYQFDFVDTPLGTEWDLTRLYSSGEVTLTAIPEPFGATLAFVGFVVAAAFRRAEILR